ncbi:proepiregulin [Sorex araneus]|uniref:proepiregulin n=1 Tax=Sorex araneus TaxID=42254 RepID=UPI0024339C62|nr:proepiregulin [Sorex araneus]
MRELFGPVDDNFNKEIKAVSFTSLPSSFTCSEVDSNSQTTLPAQDETVKLFRHTFYLGVGGRFYLVQAVLGTTVIPSCMPGESEDNCTALVQTEDNPRVAQVSITKCSPDRDGYCLHGHCIYLVDMSENHCRCEVGFTGVRCEHFILSVKQPLSKEYVALTVILVILFLVVIAGSIYYFCRWYKHGHSKESKKEYERVTSGDVMLPQV